LLGRIASGSRSPVPEIFALLGFYAAQIDYRRCGTTCRSHLTQRRKPNQTRGSLDGPLSFGERSLPQPRIEPRIPRPSYHTAPCR